MINLLKIFAKLKIIWQLWNLRGFILVSFSLQCILIIGSSLRIQTSRSWAHRAIWLVYLLADWAAYYAIGLVVPFNRLEDANMYDIRSFWAPFLLLHIGGPNTIAGFSLEDNELWDRSVLHIVVQGVATITAIVRCLSEKRLLAPTMLVFVAALTRYAGRIWALYKGSLDSLRDSFSEEKAAQRGKEAVVEGAYDDSRQHIAMVNHSYDLFQQFKGIFCGLSIKTDQEVSRVRERLYYSLSPKQALIEMEIELGLAYGFFYTKIWTIIENRVGGILHLVSLASEVAALFLWVLADKHVYKKVDVRLTNALLFGGVFLDMVSLLKLVFSDLLICRLCKLCPNSRPVTSAMSMVLSVKNQKWAKRFVLLRRWSGSVKQFKLSEYKEQRCCGFRPLRNLYDCITRSYQSNVSIVELSDQVKKKIFRSIYARVKWLPENQRVLAEYVSKMFDEKELLSNAIRQICKDLGIVDTLLIWHVMTDLFYSKYWTVVKPQPQEDNETIFSQCNKQLSEYLIYLVFHQPKMVLEGAQFVMSLEDMKKRLEEIKKQLPENLRNISRLTETRVWGDEDMLHTQRLQNYEREALEKQEDDIREILSKENSGELSVQLILKLASYMAEKLDLSQETEAIMSDIWIDLLLYFAGHSSGRSHVQQLGNGGELLTVVWLMTTQLDLTINLPH